MNNGKIDTEINGVKVRTMLTFEVCGGAIHIKRDDGSIACYVMEKWEMPQEFVGRVLSEERARAVMQAEIEAALDEELFKINTGKHDADAD